MGWKAHWDSMTAADFKPLMVAALTAVGHAMIAVSLEHLLSSTDNKERTILYFDSEPYVENKATTENRHKDEKKAFEEADQLVTKIEELHDEHQHISKT
ncbi:hypothetical protein BGZ83_006439 [Gryganskiella cystojenkinii]|nr:hypothetical protein BGZ83_006439 [Gryganskiella cystojenkinii]